MEPKQFDCIQELDVWYECFIAALFDLWIADVDVTA